MSSADSAIALSSIGNDSSSSGIDSGSLRSSAGDGNSSSSSGISSSMETTSDSISEERPVEDVNVEANNSEKRPAARADSAESDRLRLRSGRRWRAKEELEVIKRVEGISSHKVKQLP